MTLAQDFSFGKAVACFLVFCGIIVKKALFFLKKAVYISQGVNWLRRRSRHF